MSLPHFPTASIFTLKNQAGENMESVNDGEKDDFQTDEDEEMDMEVDKQTVQKRKKVYMNMCVGMESILSRLLGFLYSGKMLMLWY